MDERGEFLSTLPAGRGQRRLAVAVVLVSLGAFLVLVPFARTPLTPVWAFIPIYQSALALNDLITAVLLFGQFGILRARPLLVLAAGYLFTALMAVGHMTTFPGLFSPGGLLGAGPQTTAWLYMFWHGGFPFFVIAYARLGGRPAMDERRRSRTPIVLGVVSAFALAAGFTLLGTAGHDVLPAIMDGHHYTAAMLTVVSTVWGLSLLALAALWRRRPPSVLDVWLMVVMCAWLLDIALAAVLNAGRFDLGFYAGRIYGLLAASFVLVVLLLENGLLYARLAGAHAAERQERLRAQRAEEALERHNRELEQVVAERTQRLLQSEKVATMGSLLAGVAHELNNPLAVLLGHAQLLTARSGDAAVAARAEKIGAAAERCVRIVRNFLSLARQRAPERGAVSLNLVIREALEMLAYELRSDDVDVRLDLADRLPLLWADGHQLHQVVVNLVTNAHHAMRRQTAPRRISVATRIDDDRRRVRLVIADTGPGIPPEIRDRVFDPFFTTKPAGEGTGLGLSLCRGIVEEHGGTITTDGVPGGGAAFTIELPALEPAQGTPRDPSADALPPVGSRRILVVDDEPEIAAILRDVLSDAGHRVDVATSGAAALERLSHGRYDLVLSDTKMPSLDGIGLYRELQRRFPELHGRMVFLTGDVLDREKQAFFESTGAPVLAKPFDLAEVRRLVHRMLTDASQPPAG